MKSTLQSHLGVSLRDDRGRLLEPEVTELADDDLLFEEVLDGWSEIFRANGNDIDVDVEEEEPMPTTKRGETLWLDEVPTAKWPSLVPPWLEKELEVVKSSKLALKAS